ncbi:glycosyltransferase family 4 protein [Clostridium sp. DL1XJH146]
MNISIDGRAAFWYRGTGIGTYTYQLIYSLIKKYYNNHYNIYAPSQSKENIHINNKNSNINFSNNNYSGYFWDDISTPPKYLDDKADIYHIPHNGIGMPSNKLNPIIITLHDIIPYKMPETVSDSYLKIFHKYIDTIIDNADGIITVSQYSKNDIATQFNYPKEKIFVTHLSNEEIYYPIDSNLCKNFIHRKYKINDDFILYVGGFSPRKNITGLIEAFSNYINLSKDKNLKLVIAGKKGLSYSTYKKRVEDLKIENKVIFTGYIPVNHMPIFYNACEIFVYPSFYEGFGLPPIEAMACGTPVIASSLTSIPEIIEDAAYYINPNAIEEITNSLTEVLNNQDLKQELIKKGLKKSSEYSWDKTAKETLTAYKAVCNQS